jgi:CRISPR-associated protein Cas1
MKRSLVITQPASISLDLGRLKVQSSEKSITIPVEDLDIVVLDHSAIQITGPLLGKLCSQGVCTVVSDEKHMPVGLLLPFQNNVLTAQILRGQIGATVPVKKKIWQSIIKEKIRAQARLLIERTGSEHSLGKYALEVKSGDSTNREAAAAGVYFSELFGGGFTRLRQDEVNHTTEQNDALINGMLNYGYAVLRASVARAVVGAGLNPALGVFHRHRNNPFALADDLMEPLRPLVDREVCRIIDELTDFPEALNPTLKRRLVSVLSCEVYWNSGRFPLDVALSSYASDVRQCLLGEVNRPRVPSA